MAGGMKAMLIAALLALVAVPALGQGGYDSDTVVTASYLFPDADCETIGEDVLAAAAAAVEAFLESLPGVDDVVIVDNCGSVVLTASITFEEDVQPSEVASVITTSQDPPLPAEVASTLGEPTVTVFAPTSAPATPPPTPAPTFAGSGDVIVVTYSFDAIDCDTVDPALVADIISDIESTFSNAGGVVSVTVTTSCDNSIEFTVVIQLSPDISQQETVTLTVIANSPSSVFSTEVVSRTGLPSTELSIIDGPTAGPTSSPTAPPPTPAPTATSAPTTSAPFVCTAGPGQFCCQTDADCAPAITSQFGLFCNLGNFLCNAGPAPPGTPAPTASPPGTPAPTASPPGTPAPTSGCSAPPGQFCCATDDDCAPSVTGQFGLFCFLGNNLCNAGPAPGVPSPPGSPAPSPPGTSAPTKPSLCISALGQICCDSDAQCTEEVTGLKDLFCNLENFLCNAGPRPSAPPGSDADCNALEDQFCCATDADCAMKYTGQEGLACNSDNDLCWVPLR